MDAARAPLDTDSYGVLVGWTHGEFTGKLDLKLQTVQSTRRESRDDVDVHHFVMTPNQAVLLANYLLRITNQSAPPRRGLLTRWFG